MTWQTGGLTDDARESFARLLHALDDLEARGLVPPCRNPARAHLWTSDDPTEREAATHGCATCPIRPACTEHAPAERFHVWAGADRTPRPTTKKGDPMTHTSITCAAPGCLEFTTVDRRHVDNLTDHWRCPTHNREKETNR